MIQSFLRLARIAGVAALLHLLLPAFAVSAEKVPVSEELERLAVEYEFTVRGLEQTEEAFGRAEGEKLYPRLRRLLENFDHVIVQTPGGGVDRVIVIGEKVPFDPPPQPVAADVPQREVAEGGDIVLQTERRGTQHVVRVSLEGANGAKVPRELHVDTGADYLVLPKSLIRKLGMQPGELNQREMQTANGKVNGRIGTLPALWLGENRIVDIETAFIEDGKLGSNGLLGMSVLGRYKMTMDDDKNSITLGRKGGEPASAEPEAQDAQEAPRTQGAEAVDEEGASSDPGDKTP